MKLVNWALTASILFGVAVVILTLATDTLLPTLESYICEEDQTLIRISTPSRDGDGEEISFYCEHNFTGNLTSADGQMLLAMAGAFAPLGVSLIWLARHKAKERNARTRTQRILQLDQTGYESPIEGQTVDLHIHMPNVSKEALRDERRSPFAPNQREQAVLKAKLRQLEEAYHAGLIDASDYQEHKQTILDDLRGI